MGETDNICFNNVGKILFKESLFDSDYIRKQINRKKRYVMSNLDSDNVVAIAVERTDKMLYTLFALLECNVTFLPIDTMLPMERVSYMLQNAGVQKVIVSGKERIGIYGDYEYILEDDMDVIADGVGCITTVGVTNRSKRPVYILYTSGSTGKPKAVSVTYKGFNNFLKAVPKRIDFRENEKIACFTTFSFDIFFLEAVLGLIMGLTVVLADEEEHNNPKSMVELIEKHKIEVLQMTPSRMRLLMLYMNNDLSFMQSVKTLMLGGEKFTNEMLFELRQNGTAKIYNMYGPTETTIWSTISDLTDKDEVDIGEPIENTRIYIVDDNKKILESGIEGEICIGGDGLAEGYYNQKELTDKAFIILPEKPEERVYCTGDIGKYDKNGSLHCFGRMDNQVKIRGYRIEPEEIEETLKQMNGISAALVCYDKEKQSMICFYMAEKELEENEIREFLMSKLPEYMVPSRFCFTDTFMYTVSGKADRVAMLDRADTGNSNIEESIEDETEASPLAHKILEIFKEVFREETVDVQITRNTKLSKLGIHSLNYIQIVAEIEVEFDIEFEEDYLKTDAFDSVVDMIQYVNNKIMEG